MRDVLAVHDAWRAEGLRVGRAVLVRAHGSSPRAEGATLLVAEDGRLAGSVSGGGVEAAAAQEVQAAIADGHSRLIRYGISDETAWGVGLACGGVIDVLVQPRVDDALTAAAASGEPVAVVVELPAVDSAAAPREPLVVRPDGSGGSAGTARRAASERRAVDLSRVALELLERGESGII